MLPFPVRRILPAVQILISSMVVQKSACPTATGKRLSTVIGSDCRCCNQPLPGVSRKQRYNTLDFPRESRVPRNCWFLWILPVKGERIPSEHPRQRETLFPFEIPLPTGMLLAPIGNPEPKGLCPSGHPACPCSGYPPCSRTLDMFLPEQVKPAQRFARIAGIFLCRFLFSDG